MNEEAANQLSEWQVRQEAERVGIPTSHSQFRSYVKRGLLLPSASGHWPRNAVSALIRIRKAEAEARPLPRRVVRLRSDYLMFPVPPAQLRMAMIEMAGPRSIEAPMRKLRQINTAFDRFNRGIANRLVIPTGQPIAKLGRPATPLDWAPPHSKWIDLLKWAPEHSDPEDFFGERAALQYHTDHSYAIMATGIWPTEREIPLEERILILMVRQLHFDRHGHLFGEEPVKGR